MKRFFSLMLTCFIIFCITGIASAHVPYIERVDYSKDSPFHIWKMIEISKAFYAWIDNVNTQNATDIDVYMFNVRDRPVNLYVELIVPVVDDYYQDFVPWFALIGPELPAIDQPVPFSIPKGYGAVIKENADPGDPRETFFEPFGGKSYYNGPILDRNISTPGTYFIYVWDPYQMGGDYVLTVGKGEFFGPIDIIRGIINTIIIRNDGELHVSALALI